MNLDQGAQRQFLSLHVNSMLSFEYTHHFIWRCSRDCWGHALGDNFCRDPGGPACRLKVLATARCGLCFGHKFWPCSDPDTGNNNRKHRTIKSLKFMFGKAASGCVGFCPKIRILSESAPLRYIHGFKNLNFALIQCVTKIRKSLLQFY